jgi:hypothetical protein
VGDYVNQKINVPYFGVLVIVLFYFFATFVSELVLSNFNNEFFWCISSNYFESVNLYLPVHCDEGPYLQASESIDYFFSESNPYQKRPGYVLSIYLIRSIINFLTLGQLSNYIEFRVAMILIQFVIIYLIGISSAKFFKINHLNFHNILILILVFSIPNIRWNTLMPSHGNITLLLLLISLNRLSYKSLYSDYIFYLLMGLGALFHRSAIAYGLIILFLEIIKNKNQLINRLSYFVLLLIPSLSYEGFFIFSKYKSFDWNKEIYGQFYWIIDIFNKNYVAYHDSSCQQLNTFLMCNIDVTKSFVLYFLVGLFYLFTVIMFNLKLIESKQYFYLAITSFLIYIFWSLQGIYPNFRFINYSLGYFMFLSLIYLYQRIEDSIFFGVSILIYEFSILYMEPYAIGYLKPNYITYISILTFICSIIKGELFTNRKVDK